MHSPTTVVEPRRVARAWRRAFLWALVAAAIALTINLIIGELRPGNVWGVTYGAIAFALLLIIIGWAWRRRAQRIASKMGLGRAQHWLQLHIYGGLLFMLLVLMHAGFRMPSGIITTALWWLSLWTTVSGLVGLALQRWVPRMLASGLATEAIYERIPELVTDLRERAARMVEDLPEPVRALYHREVAGALEAPRRRLIFFLDITGGIGTRLEGFAYVARFLAPEERAGLDALERIYRTKLELDAHYTLQYALRVWLVGHVPPAVLLLIIASLHLFTVLYY